jgi:hypothetical protein
MKLNSLTPGAAITLLTVFVCTFFAAIRIYNDDGRGWRHIITSDGRGYYAYLPALFIYQDPTYETVIRQEAEMLGIPGYKPGYRVEYQGHYLNKYFAGEALLLTPFFLAGTFFAWISHSPLDGYSFFFQFFIGMGALFYLIMGFRFLRKVLDHFGIDPHLAAFAMLALFFGTNLFYYSLWQPTMSHLYSFFAINGFMYAGIRLSGKVSWKNSLQTGLFAGMIMLIRPTNAVVFLLFPMLAGYFGDFRLFIIRFVQKRWMILWFFIPVLSMLSVQVLLWFWQTGSFALWPYRDEGFRFDDPQFVNVLFSYRKGLFTYSPILILIIPGVFYLWRKNRWQALVITLFMLLSSWIIASWWCWYYGDGFGLRAFIDFYGIAALLIAIGLTSLPTAFWRMIPGIAAMALVFMNLVQTWQYTHNVIHPNSMNREKYRHIFMRTDSAVINGLGGNKEMAAYHIRTDRPAAWFRNNLDIKQKGWINNMIIRSSGASSGIGYGFADGVYPFGPTLQAKISGFLLSPSAVFIECEAMVRDSLPGASNSALMVFSIDSVQGRELWWQPFKLNDFPRHYRRQWERVRLSLMTPVIANQKATLRVYIWQTGKKGLLIDDMSVKIFTPGRP